MEYIPTNIRLTAKQHERLRKESYVTKKSQAEIVREALEMRWAQKEKGREEQLD
jgi:predicted DNA-binding protein